eukprot:RCo011839
MPSVIVSVVFLQVALGGDLVAPPLPPRGVDLLEVVAVLLILFAQLAQPHLRAVLTVQLNPVGKPLPKDPEVQVGHGHSDGKQVLGIGGARQLLKDRVAVIHHRGQQTALLPDLHLDVLLERPLQPTKLSLALLKLIVQNRRVHHLLHLVLDLVPNAGLLAGPEDVDKERQKLAHVGNLVHQVRGQGLQSLVPLRWELELYNSSADGGVRGPQAFLCFLAGLHTALHGLCGGSRAARPVHHGTPEHHQPPRSHPFAAGHRACGAGVVVLRPAGHHFGVVHRSDATRRKLQRQGRVSKCQQAHCQQNLEETHSLRGGGGVQSLVGRQRKVRAFRKND